MSVVYTSHAAIASECGEYIMFVSQAQSGKAVNLDDLPPPVLLGEGGGGPQTTTAAEPPPQKTKQEISDEELMAWAGHSKYCNLCSCT